MATHLIKRLLRRRSPIISIPSFINHNSQYQTLTSSIDSRLRSILPSPPKVELEKTEVKYNFIYPSFSYGLTVNPVFQKIATEEDQGVVGEGENGLGEMLADSTKKKRKRKMNKHKYKKLMKRSRNTS